MNRKFKYGLKFLMTEKIKPATKIRMMRYGFKFSQHKAKVKSFAFVLIIIGVIYYTNFHNQ